jgi:hypothetical protein
MQDEWEKELERLTSRFEREMQMKRKRDDQNVLTLRHQQEKEDLEKNMTLRRDKKKESITRKMLEHERYLQRNFATSDSERFKKLFCSDLDHGSFIFPVSRLWLNSGDVVLFSFNIKPRLTYSYKQIDIFK